MRQFLRSAAVALNNRGYHASGTVMVRPSRRATLRESLVIFTSATRSSAVSAKMPMPGLQEFRFVFGDQFLNPPQFLGRKPRSQLLSISSVPGQSGLPGFLQYTAATYCSIAIYRFTCAAWHQDLALGRRDLAWPAAPSAARRPRPRGRPCRRCPGPRCAAETACRLAQLPLSAGGPDLGSHRPTRSCDRPWLAGPPVPGAAPTPRTSRRRDHGSFRRICDRSAGFATATWTSGTKLPPSRAACTATPPRPHPDPLWSGAPTCRRSEPPP